jgi:hypothetical protein
VQRSGSALDLNPNIQLQLLSLDEVYAERDAGSVQSRRVKAQTPDSADTSFI